MEVVKELSAQDFLNKNEEILLKRESEHNLILGLSDSILKSVYPSKNALFLTVLANGKIEAQALRTSPEKPLALSYMSKAAVETLANYLKNEIDCLKGIVGPIEVVNQFKKNWDADSNIGMHQGIYQLADVIHPDYEGGKIRLASFDDLEIVKSFSLGFLQECFPNEKNSEERISEIINGNLKNETMFLWVTRDNEIVSTAARKRESKNAATISWVYTPAKHRNKGHASRVVAALSQKIIDDGKAFCNLFTDLSNPTSNSIYQQVGYQKIGESMHIHFN